MEYWRNHALWLEADIVRYFIGPALRSLL